MFREYCDNLHQNSIVFDVGGYTGTWAKDIYSAFKSNMYIFEPLKRYYDILKNSFSDEKTHIFNYGLFDSNKISDIYISADSTGLYHTKSSEIEQIQLRSMKSVLEELNISHIDAMEINIEGSEYVLMNHIFEHDIIKIVDVLCIQFHRITENYDEKRKAIIEKLKETHTCAYSNPNNEYYWDIWKIKPKN